MLDLELWRPRQQCACFAACASCRQFFTRYAFTMFIFGRGVWLLTLLFFLLPLVFFTSIAVASQGDKLNIQLFNGTAVPIEPLANTEVTIQRFDTSGIAEWHSSASSDANGLVVLDLPDISSSQAYRIEVKSPSNQHIKYSQWFTNLGDYEFVVGNLPVNVRMVDAKSQQPIINEIITAYRIESDGKKSWYASHVTNDNGELIFDLDGIGEGASFELRTRVYNQFNHVSSVINRPMSITMNMGETRIQLFNGSSVDNGVFTGAEVTIHQLAGDGLRSYFGEAIVDDAGWLKLNLDGIDDGQTYQLSLYSQVSGQLLFTPVIDHSGEYQFTLGNLPLNVRLVDAQNQQALGNALVEVYKLSADGGFVWFTEKLTDNKGELAFDLPGLGLAQGQGEIYRLSTKALGPIPMVSSDITATGDFDFVVGNTELQVFNASLSGNPAFADTNVALYQVVNGEQVWVISGNTDSTGKIRFDLADDKSYQFRVNSPVNGKSKFSDVIVKAGSYQMSVGNPEVKVRLSNVLSGEIYAHKEVSAFNYDQGGNRIWYSSQLTDEHGIAVFDLDGITQGHSYLFKAAVFNSGSSFSQPISSVQDVDFKVGAVPVTLIDRDSNLAISHKRIAAYLMMDNGALQWLAEGSTDDSGVAIFDFEHFYSHFATRIVLKAIDPFGESKRYYGPVITDVGAVDFYVKQGAYGDVDLLPPNLSIDAPVTDIANAQGFVVSGLYGDDIGVSRIEVTVIDGLKGEHLIAAQLVDDGRGGGAWSAVIDEQWLSVGQQVYLVATAFDYGLNQATTLKRFMVTQDTSPPNVVISSHQTGDSVNVSGFTLLGHVSDDIEVAGIHASVIDPLLGTSVFEQPLTISNNGQWAFSVTNGKMSPNQQVIINLTAIDINNKQTTASIGVQTIALSSDPLHLVNRITFGLTPQLLARINNGDDYLTEQLAPWLIDDSVFEQQMATMSVTNKQELQDYLLQYMAGSKKQLREVMAWFWENHFSTNLNSHGQVSYELAENRLFRQHALGNFRDLLAASAKSPAMIRYLNNQQNVSGRANENYAREIMELHTLGVDGGYSATDIAELSKIFTGWHEQDGVFSFNDELHDNSTKLFLGQTIVGDGVNEGELVLDLLSTHPSTAGFICRKLVALFVSDEVINSLQNQCAAEFLATDGNITSVLQLILTSSEFVASEQHRNKVRTPLELVLATARGYASEMEPSELNRQLAAMGMSLFEYPVPTGFSEHSADWLNTNAMLQRIRLVTASSYQQNQGFTIDFKQLLLGHGIESAEAVVSFLFELALGNEFSDLEHQIALEILNQQGGFDIDNFDADDKLNRLLGTVLSFPGFQYQ